LEAVFVLLELSSPSRRIFIGSHSLPPLWFVVSILHNGVKTRLGSVDEELYEGILFAYQDSEFAQQD
jgi:hypothetical protein